MATKVKPIRLNITGTPNVGQVPTYVDADTFAWGAGGGGGGASFGRFLSLWDCTTGQPISFPEATPYNYLTGDYFIVETVSSATPPVNYRPTGSSYTGTASSVTELDEIEVGDTYVYDGTTWLLQSNHGKTVTFANIAGDPYDNANLDSALDAKQDVLVSGTNIKTVNNNSLVGSGNVSVGDMKYTDYNWTTLTGNNVTLALNSQITPAANFTINAPGTIKDGQEYILRVTSGGTVYAITLGTNISNPNNVDTTLTANSVDQFVFLAVGGQLELQPRDKDTTYTAGNGIDIDASNKISTTFNYGESSTAAATTPKTVSIPAITSLNIGQTIIVKTVDTNTAGDTSLQLNNFPAYQIRYNGAALTTTTDSYVWGANMYTLFMFDGSHWETIAKSYDLNTTYSLNVLYDAGKYTAGTGTYALSRYSLVMEKDNGTWEKITNTSANYTTGTTKTVNTNGFRLNHIRYYNTTTNVANGAFIATNTLSNQAASVDLRYSTNCGGTTTWAEGDYIYLVGTMGVDGLFYLDTTTWWTNQLPVSNDGKLYIRIGLCLAASGYTTSFLIDRPIFYYDNGIKIYQQADNKADAADMNTKTFTLSSTSDTTTAQAAYDWYVAGKNPILMLGDVTFSLVSVDSSLAIFESSELKYPTVGNSYSSQKTHQLRVALSSGTVTGVSDAETVISTYLETGTNYTTPYTPEYNGSPATKKYVDDNAGIKNDTTGTTTTVTKIRAGTEAEYALITPDANTIYHIY